MKIETARSALRMDTLNLSPGPSRLRASPDRTWRRLAFWVPVTVATVLGTALGVAATSGVPSVLRWPLLVLLAVNVAYMAVTGTPGVLGFLLHVSGRRLRPVAAPSGLSRTALVMPVYNEDPALVFGEVGTMARALAEAGVGGVDLFVLSDTRDAAAGAAELAAFEALRAALPPVPRLHYRRRAENSGRKVGNLAEFCDRWGDTYDYMLVLDADSLMGASAIARLIGLMDSNPRAGIIQTVPYPVGRHTLFARLQQFGARLYTPLLVEGLTFWQQSDGNYWGHNAIIRVAPFRAHCTLPVLPGREPFGGEILCHDVVEAGLMRGAGWDVWVLPEVVESYEMVPANLLDFVGRERRWCQGNLQHKALLPLPGLRPIGRFHLAYGIFTYLSAPAALLFLALGTLDAATGGGFAAALLSGPAGVALAALGAVLLYAGKLTSLGAALADADEAAGYGGRLALLGSAAAEQVAAVVVSALLIVSYTRFVLDLVLGRSVRWDPQSRDDRGVTWREGWARMRAPAILGVTWLAALPLVPHAVAWWCAPLVAGLLGAVPLAVWSSRTSLGRQARLWNLLVTPEEHAPAPILRAFWRTAPAGVGAAEARVPAGLGVLRLVPTGGDTP